MTGEQERGQLAVGEPDGHLFAGLGAVRVQVIFPGAAGAVDAEKDAGVFFVSAVVGMVGMFPPGEDFKGSIGELVVGVALFVMRV